MFLISNDSKENLNMKGDIFCDTDMIIMQLRPIAVLFHVSRCVIMAGVNEKKRCLWWWRSVFLLNQEILRSNPVKRKRKSENCYSVYLFGRMFRFLK